MAEATLEAENDRAFSWPLEKLVNRFSAFMLAFAALWVLSILGRTSTTIALLNWSLAFIVDDFSMAANYRSHHQVPPPPFDRVKISLGGLLTYALFCVVLFQEFNPWVAGAGTAVVLALLVLLPVWAYASAALQTLMATWGVNPVDWLPDDDESLPSPGRQARCDGSAGDNVTVREALDLLLANQVLTEFEHQENCDCCPPSPQPQASTDEHRRDGWVPSAFAAIVAFRAR